MSTTYKVSGMDCEGCVKAVTRAITGLAPGSTVSVDLPTGHVTVNGTVEQAVVEDAVKMAGFTFEGKAA